MNTNHIWNFLKQKGLTDEGVAGLMGNLYAESGLDPRNLQQVYENRIGMTDEQYTTAVDNSTYTNFVYDSAGYGLAQWTYYSRKQGLLNYAKQTNRSIGDLNVQLEFLWQELNQSFRSVVSTLTTSHDILECSNIVLLKFERPADTSITMQQRRANFSKSYFDKYHTTTTTLTEQTKSIIDFKLISPNRTSPRQSEIDTVTIHCVVGQCTAESLGQLFYNPARKGSSNYGVDRNGRIGQYVEESDRAWTSGGKDLDGNPIYVNGISGSMNDHRAITIEVASDTFEPYAVTPAAYEGLIKLLVDICKRHPKIHRLRWKANKALVGDIENQNMTAHRWFAMTACPGDYLFSHFGDIATEVNRRLDAEVLNDINIEEDNDMTVERFKELWQEMREELQDNDSSAWSKEARDWAISTGLINGSGVTENGEPNCMWADILTREQFVTVLYRFFQMFGNKQ